MARHVGPGEAGGRRTGRRSGPARLERYAEGGGRRPRALLAGAALAGLLCASVAAPVAGQEAAGEPAPPDASPDTSAVAALEEPAMAEAPDAFRVSVAGGVLSWSDEEGRPRISDSGLWGLDVESRVNGFVAFRLAAAYGSATASGTPPADSLPGTTDVAQYVVDLAAELRAGFPPLERIGVVPFGTVGLGTVVHDPSAEALGTKSQSAWAWGAGVEVEALPASAGLRGEWRRYRVDAEDLFDPLGRSGRVRSAGRFLVTLYWSL